MEASTSQGAGDQESSTNAEAKAWEALDGMVFLQGIDGSIKDRMVRVQTVVGMLGGPTRRPADHRYLKSCTCPSGATLPHDPGEKLQP